MYFIVSREGLNDGGSRTLNVRLVLALVRKKIVNQETM